MNIDIYAMAERDARYIGDVVSRGESWKKDHDDAMKVLELEGLFCFISNAVDKMFEVDNIVHGERTADQISEWNGVFEKFLIEARRGMDVLKIFGEHLDAAHYDNAECTPNAIGEVYEKIDAGLTSIKEWREWTPPKSP